MWHKIQKQGCGQWRAAWRRGGHFGSPHPHIPTPTPWTDIVRVSPTPLYLVRVCGQRGAAFHHPLPQKSSTIRAQADSSLDGPARPSSFFVCLLPRGVTVGTLKRGPPLR
eukprot:scaffold7181_cov113-Isochrysis_galbana.AAC.6